MSEVEVTYLEPVAYSDGSKAFIRNFKKLPKDQQVGTYWSQLKNPELTAVKAEIKKHYLKEQSYCCAYCRQSIEVSHGGAWDTDHIVAKDTHPQLMFEAQNLCISCKDCNTAKKAKNVLLNDGAVRLPKRAKDYTFVHPHFHEYSNHIRIVKVAGFYLPKTAEGIRTIEICGLMRFILKFANYDCPDAEIGLKLQDLVSELVVAKDPTEKTMLMTLMKTLLDDGLLMAARTALAERYA